jgi:hypothetical protein
MMVISEFVEIFFTTIFETTRKFHTPIFDTCSDRSCMVVTSQMIGTEEQIQPISKFLYNQRS